MIKGKLVAVDLAKNYYQVVIFSARAKTPVSNKLLSHPLPRFYQAPKMQLL